MGSSRPSRFYLELRLTTSALMAYATVWCPMDIYHSRFAQISSGRERFCGSGARILNLLFEQSSSSPSMGHIACGDAVFPAA
jgi:hypothetical protein